MVYFQPGEWMRMMIIPESDAGILGKKKSECSYQESNEPSLMALAPTSLL